MGDGGGSRPPRKHSDRKRKLRNLHLPTLFDLQQGICALCGLDMQHLWFADLDHFAPKGDGGSDELGNLSAMHSGCNRHKSSRDVAVVRDQAEREGVPVDRAAAHEALCIALSAGLKAPWDNNGDAA